jgi:hypothetical protein
LARGVRYESLPPRLGITAPVRLRGPLSGVIFRTLLPEKERARSSFEIIDCRLVLALDDLAKQLAHMNIVEVMFFSAYRPPPAGWAPSPSVALRHEGGLALDVGYFRKRNGLALNVEQDFSARPDERPCAPMCTRTAAPGREPQLDRATADRLRRTRRGLVPPHSHPGLRLGAPQPLPLRADARRDARRR